VSDLLQTTLNFLALGGLYERSRSLWPSIVCHYLFNILG